MGFNKYIKTNTELVRDTHNTGSNTNINLLKTQSKYITSFVHAQTSFLCFELIFPSCPYQFLLHALLMLGDVREL